MLDVFFACEMNVGHVPSQTNNIVVSASLHQWNRILSAESNLESIITGGCGIIFPPANYNIRREYNLLVDWAYKLQFLIKNRRIFL